MKHTLFINTAEWSKVLKRGCIIANYLYGTQNLYNVWFTVSSMLPISKCVFFSFWLTIQIRYMATVIHCWFFIHYPIAFFVINLIKMQGSERFWIGQGCLLCNILCKYCITVTIVCWSPTIGRWQENKVFWYIYSK